MKLFFSQSDLLGPVSRSYLSEWVKPLFPEHRHSIYGLDPKDLEYCKEQSDADAFLLPFTWNYYLERGYIQDALALIEEYGQWNKPVYTWVGGDHSYRIPEGDFILFRLNGYQSMRRKNEYAYPVIIRDPLEYLNLQGIKILQKDAKPRIGFCGLADKNWIEGSLRAVKTSMSKLVNSIMSPYLDLTHPISGTALRRKVLHILANSNEVETDFLIRSSSGGQKINSKTQKLEFWKNLLTSPYILCVRGTGNYSARFYEALSMGRIPVFINTDCVLPFNNQINWENHCVWVESDDYKAIVKKLNFFHERLSKYEFEKLQYSNRKLWADLLTFDGFYHRFVKYGI